MMWSLMLLLIGVFHTMFRETNKWIRYFADASYWMYLIHLPIVIGVQILVAELSWHWSIKLCVVSLITILVATLMYDILVRDTWLGQLLNGRRNSPMLFSLFRKKQEIINHRLEANK
jgi:peptidoglycan/LPS O-acetylase OafA/YrhL